MRIVSTARAAWLASCLLAAALPSAAAEDGYPATVATIEQMRMVKPMAISFPRTTTMKSKEMRTVVIVSHVDKEGRVVKSKIQQPSGAHHVDEAALLGMRSARFQPYSPDGEPVEVSVVIPMHLNRDDVRRDRSLGTRGQNAPLDQNN